MMMKMMASHSNCNGFLINIVCVQNNLAILSLSIPFCMILSQYFFIHFITTKKKTLFLLNTITSSFSLFRHVVHVHQTEIGRWNHHSSAIITFLDVCFILLLLHFSVYFCHSRELFFSFSFFLLIPFKTCIFSYVICMNHFSLTLTLSFFIDID